MADWVSNGRQHEIVANNFAEDILGVFLPQKSSHNNLRSSKNKFGKSGKSINGSTTGLKNTKENQ